MVWACQQNYLGIFNQLYYAAILQASQSQFKIYLKQHTHKNSKQIWSLDHAQMFLLGCKELVISTDHKHL